MCTSTRPGRGVVPEECRFHSPAVPCTALHWCKGGYYNHVSNDSFRTDIQNISVVLRNSFRSYPSFSSFRKLDLFCMSFGLKEFDVLSTSKPWYPYFIFIFKVMTKNEKLQLIMLSIIVIIFKFPNSSFLIQV